MAATDPHHLCHQLALRGLPESALAVLLWLIVVAGIPALSQVTVITMVTALGIVGFSLARGIMAGLYLRGRVGNRRLWLAGYSMATLIGAGAWGLSAAYAAAGVTAVRELAVLLLATNAIVLAGMVALGSYRLLQGAHAAIVLAPLVAVFLQRENPGMGLPGLLLLMNGGLAVTAGLLVGKQYRILRTLSDTDSLTGLPNRARFRRSLDDEVQRARRSPVPLTLMLVDIDHFGLYNENYGYARGDQVLEIVGERISQCLRRSQDLAAHFEGGRFACLLPECSPEGAVMLAESIRQGVAALELPHLFSPIAPRVTVSLGVVTWRPHGDCKAELLIDEAEQRLSRSKDDGRNQAGFAVIN